MMFGVRSKCVCVRTVMRPMQVVLHNVLDEAIAPMSGEFLVMARWLDDDGKVILAYEVSLCVPSTPSGK
jgi:hypothetical protein